MEKYCNMCNELKPLIEFHKNKRNKDGHQETCKPCRKEHYLKNKGTINEYKKEWYNNNKSNILEKRSKYYYDNRDVINHNRRELYKNDDEYRNTIKEQNRNYYINNAEKMKETQKGWVPNNKSKYREIQKRYYDNNKHIVSWRRILKRTLKELKQSKDGNTFDILGYSAEDLKEHMESLFLDGMSWDNHGEWHIDHIKPLSSFNEDTSPKVVNALHNLQPLWASDNLSKGNRI